MGKYAHILWGAIYAFLPALAFGLLAGFLFHKMWVALIVWAGFFGFGLDVLFGKGVECRLYRKR